MGHRVNRMWRVLAAAAVVLGGVAAARAEAPGETRFTAGKAALEDGLYGVAERELRAFVSEGAAADADAARVTEAVVLLGRALLGQGRGRELGELLQKHRRWLKDAPPGTEAFWRAMAAYASGDAQAAVARLADFETQHPDSPYAPKVLRLRAAAFRALGELESAIETYARYEARFPGGVEAADNLLDWGTALMEIERWADAAGVLERLAGREPETPTVVRGRFRLGHALLSLERWGDASAVLTGVVESPLAGGDLKARGWLALARVHAARTNDVETVRALVNGIESARESDTLLALTRRLGRHYIEHGSLEAGLSLLKGYVATAPQDGHADELQLAVAQALYQAGRHEDALMEYQHYLEAYTNAAGLARATEGRGWALFELGRFAESAVAFEKAHERLADPDARARALYKLGDATFADGRYERAAEIYASLLTGDIAGERAVGARFQYAECLAMSGRAGQAEANFRKLAEMYPAHPLANDALLRIAELQQQREHYDAAAASYTHAMGVFSNGAAHARAMLGRGLVRYHTGAYEEALRDFEAAALDEAPDALIEEARFRAILCRFRTGRDAEAVAHSAAFLDQYPDSHFAPRVHFGLARYAYNTGDFERARLLFQRFYETYPDNRDAELALVWAGRAALRREEYLEAIEIFGRLVRERPASPRVAEARFEQGNALCELAKFGEAILVFQEVVNRFPASEVIPETWLRIGDCQFMLGAEDAGRYASAMEAYRAAADHPNARLDLAMHAEYKLGRCLQKLDREDEAVQQYYANVMIRFLKDRESGGTPNEEARVWFGRASREAADILERRKEWRKVVSILERVLGAGIKEEPAIRERIRKIRAENWWLFY